MTETVQSSNAVAKSHFDGGLIESIFVQLASFLVTIFTIGLLYPWAMCFAYGWKVNHTVIEGKRLHFSGSGMSLFGNWIKWFFFCIITFGIYAFWLGIALEKWKVKHTSFA